ncbi:chemotaxis protein CheW [Thiomicrospira sp. ALE5]|uniref:chemotaxis protein CheW n=1 Tax=Thiomicrospira sp. ALE5 TaxID=748650 RepID=UPI0008EB17E8|nr:chemotaxis protein CheW [Thiomicrospira sp. ALE5]SFR51068.1 purine-binding chemotaxis protein CheW [Thiomicrospira sp. ALE5]
MSRNQQEFLTFMLGPEQYAINILCVQEIRGWHEPDPLPNVPDYVRGVIDLRGTLVPVIDLRTKFKLDASFTVTTVVIVVQMGQGDDVRTLGLVVDAVSDVKTFDTENLQPAPDISSNVDQQYILGLTSIKDQQDKAKMVILLNLEKLIAESLLNQLGRTA